MKTARITFLSTPEFKSGLEKLARKDEISVGELVRRRFSLVQSADERELAELASAVKLNAAAAKASLADGLAAVEAALKAVGVSRKAAGDKLAEDDKARLLTYLQEAHGHKDAVGKTATAKARSVKSTATPARHKVA